MDVQVKVWYGAGMQPSMVSQLDQREQEVANLCLAMTQGSTILLTCLGLPENQRLLQWGCVSSSEFTKLFWPSWEPWLWRESLTAWQHGEELRSSLYKKVQKGKEPGSWHLLSVLPKVSTHGQPFFQYRKPLQKLKRRSRSAELWVHAVGSSLQFPGKGKGFARRIFTYIWQYWYGTTFFIKCLGMLD